MAADTRPFRSVLYIPAANARALEKARDLPADAIIFDLEDAVAPSEKPDARERLAATLAAGGYGDRALLCRINALDTPWGADDVARLAPLGPEALLLPKVNAPADVGALAHLLDGHAAAAATRIWAMIETPAGVLSADAIARAPRMAGFVVGTNDLAKDLGTRSRPDRLPMMAALQTCVLAARAAGIVVVDGVYNAFRDDDGLAAECAQGRDLGMDGKTLIHPAQIAAANAAFSPDPDEIDLARRQIAAFEEAEAEGRGVAVLDGRIVENLHVDTARALLARAETIAAREAAQ